MTGVWSGHRASSDTGRRIGAPAGLAVGPLICCLSVAAVFVATLPYSVATAGANQVTNLQTEAAQLSKEMLLEQLQINAYEQQRATDLAQVSADDQALAETDAQIAATRRRITHDMTELRRDAIDAYIEDGTEATGTSSLFSSAPAETASVVYDQVVTGNLGGALDQLHGDRSMLLAELGVEQEITSQAQQRAAQATALLAEADATEQTLEEQNSAVNGQLAAAIEQTEAAAAARATTSGAPVLPPFLVCVRQAESGGDYHAVSPTGQYMGAFQFSQPTWNEAAGLAGLPTLVGVPPYNASPVDQDLLAIALYNFDGEQPWYDPCRY